MIDMLAEALPGIILKIPFPKTMYWTAKSRPAIHSADTLDRGTAGRTDDPVRTRRRAIRRT